MSSVILKEIPDYIELPLFLYKTPLLETTDLKLVGQVAHLIEACQEIDADGKFEEGICYLSNRCQLIMDHLTLLHIDMVEKVSNSLLVFMKEIGRINRDKNKDYGSLTLSNYVFKYEAIAVGGILVINGEYKNMKFKNLNELELKMGLTPTIIYKRFRNPRMVF